MKEYVVFLSQWRTFQSMTDPAVWWIEVQRDTLHRGLSFFEAALCVATLRQLYPASAARPPHYNFAHAGSRESLCWTQTRH